MKLLFLGDVVGSRGCKFVSSKINELKKNEGIDIVVVNGENSADGNGITPASAKMLSFADVITTGNHVFKRKEIFPVFESRSNIIRPANFPEGAPGAGTYLLDCGRAQVLIVDLMGTVYMEALDNPFFVMDRILEKADTLNIFVDFHAEATSEKKAMGFYLDGKVTAVIGTHTHVQTADETVLKNGTGYITDAGMCGAEESVLGVKSEIIINKLKSKIPAKFVESDNAPFMCGVIVDFNEKIGKTTNIKRFQVR